MSKPLRFKSHRFRDLVLVGEDPQELERIAQEKDLAEQIRRAHEVTSRRLHETGACGVRTPVLNGEPMSEESRAQTKQAARRGGILSRALRKVQALTEWHAANRRASKSRTMPREYVLSAEEQALIDEHRAKSKARTSDR